MARQNEIQCDWLPARAIAERFPHIQTADLVGGVYMPNDGQTNPVDTTLALARLAKLAGAEIRENAHVTELLTRRGAITGVICNEEELSAQQVVLASGLWTRQNEK